MDPYDKEMDDEEKVETQHKNVFKLVPVTRSRPKKVYKPTLHGIFNSKYEIWDKNGGQAMNDGSLILLDRNNHGRVINKFGCFYNTEWLHTMVPSKLHSLVAETVYNGNIQNGYLRCIDHTENINMMTVGKVDHKKFTDNYMLNIELESGCTWLEIMPIPAMGGDSLANAVDVNNEIQNNGIVNIIAGWEDGSIVLSEMQVPEQEDIFHEEFKDLSQFEDHESDLSNNKFGTKGRGSSSKQKKNQFRIQNTSHEIKQPKKPNEVVFLHKDAVTSICQRPSYPFQFLSTSLDGEAILSLLSTSLSQEELVILRFSNKIWDEGIGDAAWMDPNCFITKNAQYGQLLLQDVREGEAKSPTHLYSTPNMWKINDMDLSFPYVGIAQDDGNLNILDLRNIDIDINHNLVPLFNLNKPDEACMWVKLLKDTIRVYGWFERSGIYGYRFNDENLTHENLEWHGQYDSDKYGLPKSLHVIHQEKSSGNTPNRDEDEASVYCQDVLCIGSYNGTYVYGLVHDYDEQAIN